MRCVCRLCVCLLLHRLCVCRLLLHRLCVCLLLHRLGWVHRLSLLCHLRLLHIHDLGLLLLDDNLRANLGLGVVALRRGSAIATPAHGQCHSTTNQCSSH